MRAFPVRLPSGVRYWTVLDDDLAVVGEADAFLRHVRFGRDQSESTTRAYAGSIALFLRWCARTGRHWHDGVGPVRVVHHLAAARRPAGQRHRDSARSGGAGGSGACAGPFGAAGQRCADGGSGVSPATWDEDVGIWLRHLRRGRGSRAAFGLSFFVCDGTVITSDMGAALPLLRLGSRRREGRWVDARRRRAHGKR